MKRTSVRDFESILKHINQLIDSKEFKNDPNPWLTTLKRKHDQLKSDYIRYYKEVNGLDPGDLEGLFELIVGLVRFNQSKILSFLFKNPVFLKYLSNNSFYSRVTGYGELKINEDTIIIHAISKNALETLDLLIDKTNKKYNFEHLKAAAVNNARICGISFEKSFNK